MIKLTVICLTYNHAEYIECALQSMLSQKTDFQYEILVNDDASTDNTAEIIKRYEQRYPEIIKPVFHEENLYSQGKSTMRAFLLPRAQGEYIAFCEGDDYWTDERKLQKSVEWLDMHPDYVACVHNTLWHDCSGAEPDHIIYDRPNDTDLLFEDVIQGNQFHTSSLVFRKEYLSNRPDFYYVAKGYGDYPQAIWLGINGKIRWFSGVMSVYRYKSNPKSWSSSTDDSVAHKIAHMENVIEMLTAVKPHVSMERAELVDKAVTRYKYDILELSQNQPEMLKPEYKENRRLRPVGYRIKLYLKAFVHPMYMLYRHFKY